MVGVSLQPTKSNINLILNNRGLLAVRDHMHACYCCSFSGQPVAKSHNECHTFSILPLSIKFWRQGSYIRDYSRYIGFGAGTITKVLHSRNNKSYVIYNIYGQQQLIKEGRLHPNRCIYAQHGLTTGRDAPGES